MMRLFDTHFHIIDSKYPLISNQGYSPPTFTVADYLRAVEGLNVCGGTVVSGSFHGYEYHYLIDSIGQLGIQQYAGVCNLDMNLDHEQLFRLNEAGFQGVRLNMYRSDNIGDIHEQVLLCNKLYYDHKWHTELYIDSAELPKHNSILTTLAAPFSIDHLGLSAEGLKHLYDWVHRGIKVKATGFGRLNFDPVPVMKEIYGINPDALLFGSDLPSTRAKRPFSSTDIAVIKENFTTSQQEKIFYQNAKQFYCR